MEERKAGQRGYGLPTLAAWALGLGCVIGWGSFVMPGTTFLPDAGPLGTLIGLALAGAVILVVGANYAFLASQYPGSGVSYTCTREILGEDHAFLSAWSLTLAYISLLWANATAFSLIGRYLLGDVLQWGFHYRLAGYDVYLGEILMTVFILLLGGLMTCRIPKFVASLRTFFALLLMVSVLGLFCAALLHGGLKTMFTPGFAAGEPKGVQILNIAVLTPWLFVGFETVYLLNAHTRLPVKHTAAAARASLLCGTAVYMLLLLIGASGVPAGYSGWPDYVADLRNLEGIAGMPVLHSAQAALGNWGVPLAGVAVLSALSTSVLGFYFAGSRALSAMAKEGLLPRRLSKTVNGVPVCAVYAILLASMPVPFLGRTAVGWNADVSTLSVAIVYTYVSICAYRTAGERKLIRVTGAVGVVTSVLVLFLLLVPNIFSENALATESYLMLAAWSFLGIVYYRHVFRQDRENRFGKSTIMWMWQSR